MEHVYGAFIGLLLGLPLIFVCCDLDMFCFLQVITEFCMYAGVTRELRQGLIRLAKTNGNTLGFLS
jgi:hypothetical protein